MSSLPTDDQDLLQEIIDDYGWKELIQALSEQASADERVQLEDELKKLASKIDDNFLEY
jgi:hypothetical protein